jgi:hypothetical protein
VPATLDAALEAAAEEESSIADDEFPPTKATEYSSVSLFTFEDVDPLHDVMTPLEAQSQYTAPSSEKQAKPEAHCLTTQTPFAHCP